MGSEREKKYIIHHLNHARAANDPFLHNLTDQSLHTYYSNAIKYLKMPGSPFVTHLSDNDDNMCLAVDGS
jgi:hypothetical protein